jgi:hypothetical protein
VFALDGPLTMTWRTVQCLSPAGTEAISAQKVNSHRRRHVEVFLQVDVAWFVLPYAGRIAGLVVQKPYYYFVILLTLTWSHRVPAMRVAICPWEGGVSLVGWLSGVGTQKWLGRVTGRYLRPGEQPFL